MVLRDASASKNTHVQTQPLAKKKEKEQGILKRQIFGLWRIRKKGEGSMEKCFEKENI